MEKDFYEKRALQNGRRIAPDAYDRAIDQWRKLPRAKKKKQAAADMIAVTGVNGVVWRPMGPSPITQTYESKGILKSTDGGGSWIVLGSDLPAGNTGNADTLFAGRSINTIIVDPSSSNLFCQGFGKTGGRIRVCRIEPDRFPQLFSGSVILGNLFPKPTWQNNRSLRLGVQRLIDNCSHSPPRSHFLQSSPIFRGSEFC